MKVIIPCCGRSSRFPNLPPKWTLPGHDGRPMICAAVADLKCDSADLIVTVLREHEERFHATAGLAEAFGRSIRTCILERQTHSQGETVAETLKALKLAEPFLVKDADGAFTLGDLAAQENYICTDSLNNHDLIQPRSKSYVRTDTQGRVVEIREKVVISDTFNVGGYYFVSPAQFLEHYRQAATGAATDREVYVSDVIARMLAAGLTFRARPIAQYRDWGTLREWQRALLQQQTYFVQLDGFLFERGNRYFAPRFADVRPHPTAIEAVRAVAAAGRRVVYLSIRPHTEAALTERQIRAANLPSGSIVYDCTAAPWELITAPYGALPLQSGRALELSPDNPILANSMGVNASGER